MAVIYSNPDFPNQSGSSPFNQPYAVQLNAGQMIREVTEWNPNVTATTALRMINNVYRAILDKRSWYGLKVRGQIQVGTPYSTGQVTLDGSNIIQGVGTAWTPDLIGQQFRINFTYEYQTVQYVDVANQRITLDFPCPTPSGTYAYYILQAYYALDGNIRRMLWALNQLMGWQMKVNALPVECVNTWDTWRTFLGWSTHFVTRPPTPAGQYQIEVWPSPFQKQVFPFEAYTQPPDMQADEDSPVAFIDSDAIVLGATAKALMFRPKQNPYYDPATALQVATEKLRECNARIMDMENKDNDIDQRDVMWDYGMGDEDTVPGGYGSIWAQNHG